MKNKLEFLAKFVFLDDLTKVKKEKLWFSMKRETLVHGQKVLTEGSNSEFVYFIESGEFEVNKDIYLVKERNESWFEYLRFISTKNRKFLKHLLDPDTMTLFSQNK